MPASFSPTRSQLLHRAALCSFLLLLTVGQAQGGITLVQHIGKDAGSTTSSSLAFAAANTAGNWIGVAIRAGRSNQVFTIKDSRAGTRTTKRFSSM
jgi:hypothetical protein